MINLYDLEQRRRWRRHEIEVELRREALLGHFARRGCSLSLRASALRVRLGLLLVRAGARLVRDLGWLPEAKPPRTVETNQR